jgi:hypothetical protein
MPHNRRSRPSSSVVVGRRPAAVAAGITLMAIIGATLGCTLSRTHEASAAPDADLLKRLEDESWYVVSVGGRRIGHAYIASQLRDEAGQTFLDVTQRQAFTLEHMGMKLGAESTQTIIYGPDLRPREYILESEQLGQHIALHGVVRGDELDVETTRGDTTTTKTLALADNFGGEVETTRRILEGECKQGDTFSFQAFIPELGVLDEVTIEIGEHTEIEYKGGTARALELQQKSKVLPVTITAWLDEHGVPVKMILPGVIGGIALLRVDEEEALAELEPLKLVSNIPIGAEIPDARKVRRMALRAVAGGSHVADLVPSDRRQHVTPDPDLPSEADIVVTSVAAPATPAKLPITGEEFQPWLEATEFAEAQDPEIVSLAQEIVGDETDAWEVARKLTRWVYDNMKKVKSEPAPITASQCLRQKSGDCSEHATLLTALGRAAGVPTKFCTGLVHSKGALYYHAWNEVYVGEWVAVDPAWGELTVDATHLKISDASLDSASFARSCLATGRTMGALELSLVEYETEDGKVVEPEAEAPADEPHT